MNTTVVNLRGGGTGQRHGTPVTLLRPVRRLRRWLRRRNAIRQLQALSDWQLEDIGVLRSQIRELVDHLLEQAETPAARGSAKVVTLRRATARTEHKDDRRTGMAA